ncbi:lysophospholipase L1-like esterase [Curtobacterium sp. PhB42]|uniref:SGNH/GDSL hydrolase family protein n=1 Tax=unclassified Curtobacterium TaxID=257496 RepID=UPI0010631DCF|nr:MULTISPECIES: GDSL-type esterase/lipase family protein [unclassified Curtobacterium]TDW50457.1 lysophospholipase L1-like esterase [Curtobacterium sp. PhB42]TDW55240.1 lysophospholipase L1-like esterase [Curtobacterium sp. PhB190]
MPTITDPTVSLEETIAGTFLPPSLLPSLGRRFAPIRGQSLGSGIAWLGDSITRGLGATNKGDSWPPILTGTTIAVAGDSIPTYAMLYSGGKLSKTVNAGISGNTTAQMLARVKSDVIAYKPAVCVVLGGTNDSATPVELTDFAANIAGIVLALRVAGIAPVLCTIPTINSTAQRAVIIRYNTWLRRYSAQQGIPLLDFYTLSVDPETGNLLQSAMGNTDGTHPGNIGNALLGKYAADILGPLVGASAVPVAADNTDALNLVVDGLNFGTVANGLAAPWGVYGTLPSNATPSVVTDPLVPGKMQQLALAATTAGATLYKRITPVVGRRIVISGTVTKTAGAAGLQAYVNTSNQTDTYNQLLDVTEAVTRGKFSTELVVPANTTSIDLKMFVQPGTTTFAVGQLTAYDLTTQGVL